MKSGWDSSFFFFNWRRNPTLSDLGLRPSACRKACRILTGVGRAIAKVTEDVLPACRQFAVELLERDRKGRTEAAMHGELKHEDVEAARRDLADRT